MDSTQNTFSATNTNMSRSIYQTFYSGGVINKKQYVESKADLIDNAEYQEILINQPHYESLYWHLGYQLTHDADGDYFYLKAIQDSDDESDAFDETSLKLMAILTILSRLASLRGKSIAMLGEPVQGISNSDLELVDDDVESLSFLKSLKFKESTDAIMFLIKRGFAFKVSKNRYILSKGSLAMISVILDRQKHLNEHN
jgi:hypothetical protein